MVCVLSLPYAPCSSFFTPLSHLPTSLLQLLPHPHPLSYPPFFALIKSSTSPVFFLQRASLVVLQFFLQGQRARGLVLWLVPEHGDREREDGEQAVHKGVVGEEVVEELEVFHLMDFLQIRLMLLCFRTLKEVNE